MKKIIPLIALSAGIFIQAQDYSFDRLVQYEENEEKLIQIYFNTQDDGYFMQLTDDKVGEQAEIYDRNQRKIHHFEVKPIQEQNGLIYEYKYLESKKLPSQSPQDSNIEFEFETKSDDKYYRFTDLNLFHSGIEKPFLTADLALRYAEENLFNAFNLCCLLGFDQWDKIPTEVPFVVVRAKVTDEKGAEHNYRLIDDQVVQFKLRANEK